MKKPLDLDIKTSQMGNSELNKNQSIHVNSLQLNISFKAQCF